MPGATQGAKYSLGELKLPRAAWVSLGPNPFFLMIVLCSTIVALQEFYRSLNTGYQ